MYIFINVNYAKNKFLQYLSIAKPNFIFFATNKNASQYGTANRTANKNGTLTRVYRSIVQNGLSNISGNDTLSKYQGQLVYPGMTATLDDHSIQPISYSRRNVDKSTSMRMNWTQAAVYKRNVRNSLSIIR